jgi:hypothetical protein
VNVWAPSGLRWAMGNYIGWCKRLNWLTFSFNEMLLLRMHIHSHRSASRKNSGSSRFRKRLFISFIKCCCLYLFLFCCESFVWRILCDEAIRWKFAHIETEMPTFVLKNLLYALHSSTENYVIIVSKISCCETLQQHSLRAPNNSWGFFWEWRFLQFLWRNKNLLGVKKYFALF